MHHNTHFIYVCVVQTRKNEREKMNTLTSYLRKEQRKTKYWRTVVIINSCILKLLSDASRVY